MRSSTAAISSATLRTSSPGGVAAEQVARLAARLADVDRSADRFDLHAILPRPHRVAAAEDRVAELAGEVGVAARAVDHRAGDRALMGDPGQDVAPHRGGLAAAVAEAAERA